MITEGDALVGAPVEKLRAVAWRVPAENQHQFELGHGEMKNRAAE